MGTQSSLHKNLEIRLASHVAYFTNSVPITELDEIILELLIVYDGEILFDDLGNLLGFATRDDKRTNVRYDKSEVQIFRDLLNTLSRFHLVSIEKNTFNRNQVLITKFGIEALETKEKKLFYRGLIQIPEHIEVDQETSIFPFSRFGVPATFLSMEEISPKEGNTFGDQAHEHANEIQNNLSQDIFKQGQITLLDVNASATDYNKSFVQLVIEYPVEGKEESFSTQINSVPSEELDMLLQLPLNHKLRHQWLLESKLHHLLTTATVINASELEDYVHILDWSQVLIDNRINWTSEIITLAEVSTNTTGDTWSLLSQVTPEAIIKDSITNGLWDYSLLTIRLDLEFILSNAELIEWDVDELIHRVDSIMLEEMLGNASIVEGITDWSAVTDKVSQLYLFENIENFPWNMIRATDRLGSHQIEILERFHYLDWNWAQIAKSWDINILLEHFSLFLEKSDVKVLLIKFINDDLGLQLLQDNQSALRRFKEKLNTSNVKIAENESLRLQFDSLMFLDELDLLSWGTGKGSGVECNPNFRWGEKEFERFHSKVISEPGCRMVTKSFEKISILSKNPDFSWEFQTLSMREDLDWSIDIIRVWENNLLPNTLLPNLPKSIVFENLDFFIAWCDKKSLSTYISTTFSYNEVLVHGDDLIAGGIEIDWGKVLDEQSIESLEELSTEISHEENPYPSLGRLIGYLSRNLSLNFIREFPHYKWDWILITSERFSKEQLLDENIWIELYNHLYWPYIIKEVIGVSQLSDIHNLIKLGALLSQINEEMRDRSWYEITARLPHGELWNLIDSTYQNEVFNWDWEVISSSSSIPISTGFLDKHKSRIRWDLLSQNDRLNYFFKYDKSAYSSQLEWERRSSIYLMRYETLWDFKALSFIDNLVWNSNLVRQFIDQWDWEILSNKGRLLTLFNSDASRVEFNPRRLVQFRSQIIWPLLSVRTEVYLTSAILKQFSDEEWNWNALSEHPAIELDIELLVHLNNKPWDFIALTNNPCLELSKELVLHLPEANWDFQSLSSADWLDDEFIDMFSDKDWNWREISQNKELKFNLPLLTQVLDKENVDYLSVSLNPGLQLTEKTLTLLSKSTGFGKDCWSNISAHRNLQLNPELISQFEQFWDWQVLVKEQKIDINNFEILASHENRLNWTELSNNISFIPSYDVLKRFKNKIDWKALSPRIQLNEQILDEFDRYIDWGVVSSSTSLTFTRELLIKFKYSWDYLALKENMAIIGEVRVLINELISEIYGLDFYMKIKGYNNLWSGYIYHYTHIENALKIFFEGSIKSRDSVDHFVDSAGSVVHRTNRAHQYARFYMRPKTPTQFYNECLGKDKGMSQYEQAANLKLPKCPVPVFIRLNMQEVILKNGKNCYVSSGNMQARGSRIMDLSEVSSSFSYEDLFSTFDKTSDGRYESYLRHSQSEFLVKNKVDIDSFTDITLIVRNEQDKEFLLSELTGSKLQNRIVVDSHEFDVFHNRNRFVFYEYVDDQLSITTNYQGDGVRHGEIHVKMDPNSAYSVEAGSNIISQSDEIIKAYPSLNVSISNKYGFEVYFHDDIRKQDWLIFSHSFPKHLNLN